MAEKGSPVKASKNCTRCGKPMKGHPGPAGKDCANVDIGEETPKSEKLMEMLVQQMTLLNVNLEGMSRKQDYILKAVESSQEIMMKKPSNSHMSPAVTGFGATAAESANDLFSAGSTMVNKRTKTQAQNGEFVNLTEFLPSVEVTESDTELFIVDGTVQCRPRKIRKSIDSFSTWLEAWNNYELIVLEANPHVFDKMITYRALIQACDKKYVWSAVYAYDLQFRSKCGTTHSFAFDSIDSSLYVSILDATTIKQLRRCHRCKSTDHEVKNCPFPEEVSQVGSDQKKKAQRSYPEKWYHENKEGCNNYQTGRCNLPGCRRAHVCRRCRGPDPLHRCKCSQN